MSIVFSKKKEKRSRSSSEDANNSSFMKNVTSRVSGLLPAAVTKWFSSPSSSSNANGSAQTADATDSSTDDEGPESSVTAQPPSKRMRFTSPGSFKHYTPAELTCISSNIEQHELDTCSPYGTIQSPPGRTTFRRETNFVSTPLRPDHVDRTEKDSAMFKSHSHTVSTIPQSVATKRKSLFDSPNRHEESKRACAKAALNTIRDPTQPYFKPSLLGSPFYPGRTMYGGASSSYINKPNKKQSKNAIVNESNSSDNTVSHSTRRIMDILENYSSPLADAKRIPQYTVTSRNQSLYSSFNSSAPPSNKMLSYKTQELHVPTIASILRLKQKSRLMDTTSAARQIIASHSSTSDYVPYPTHTLNTREQTDIESSKSTTKVKTRLSRPNRGVSKDAETEMPTPVSLPNAVLQIDNNNLPKFTFGTSTATSTPKPTFTPLTAEVTTKITETLLRKPDIVTSSQAPYKFSTPVRISSEAPKPQTETKLPKFTFGSPDRSIDQVNKQKNSDFSCVVGPPKEAENKWTSAKSKDWQCSDCWVFNKTDVENCVCCGGKKPSESRKNLSKCCICKLADSPPNNDKCINCTKQKTNAAVTPTLKLQDDSSKWKCDDCWVNNDENVEKCVCCGASNPKRATAEKVAAVITDNSSEWKCNDCWIKNKSSVDKCAACGAARPGAAAAATPAPVSGGSLFNSVYKPPDNALENIIKSQTVKWECPTCLVRNDADKAKCICCESERAGAIKESDIKSFNFGMNTNTTFKFGIPKTQDTPKNIDIETTSATKKEESETNNNTLPKTPTYTFGLPLKKSEDQTNITKKTDKTDDAPKNNFTFGILKTGAAPGVPANFGISAKLSEQPKITSEQDKEKPQEVPKINFSTPKIQESPKPLSNIFMSPVTSTPNTEKAAVVPTLIPQAKPPVTSIFNSSVEKKDLSNSLTLQPAASLTVVQLAAPVSAEQSVLPAPTSVAAPATAPATSAPAPTPAFSFGTGGFTPATNLFGGPTNTTVTNAITFATTLSASTNSSPFQKNDLTTTSSAMSLFPKSETPSTVSLFVKSETAASTAAALTSASPAPLFSFGGAAQNVQPEKPKFNFTFGTNNKSETQALFQPPTDNKFSFGAPTENKFSLTPGSTHGSNNALGGNGLSAGSTLGVGNGLTVNTLGSSDMGNNTQGGSNCLQTSSASGGLFGAGAGTQKENMWSTTNNTNASSNLFVSNTATNSLQKPPAFTFGSSTPFNANNSTPAFGSSAQSPPNVFGMNQTANSPPSLFGSSNTSQPSGVVFGAPAPQPAPASLFGSPSVRATSTFGSPTPSIPNFEAPSHTPTPAPAFNFGASAPQTTGVFGFGQQPQQHAGGFSFGANAGVGVGVGVAPQVQFNMGSAPNTAVRRVRKAVRRTTPR